MIRLSTLRSILQLTKWIGRQHKIAKPTNLQRQRYVDIDTLK